MASGLIFFGGWYVNLICDPVGIHSCYPVRLNYVCIADRLRGRSRRLGTKTTVRVTAKLTLYIQGGGLIRSSGAVGMGVSGAFHLDEAEGCPTR